MAPHDENERSGSGRFGTCLSESPGPTGGGLARRPYCTSEHQVLRYTFDGGSFFVATCRHAAERPANGGLRIVSGATPSEAQATSEALACLMSDKHRLYNTGFSGAKLVVPGMPDRRALLDAVARALQELHGDTGRPTLSLQEWPPVLKPAESPSGSLGSEDPHGFFRGPVVGGRLRPGGMKGT